MNIQKHLKKQNRKRLGYLKVQLYPKEKLNSYEWEIFGIFRITENSVLFFSSTSSWKQGDSAPNMVNVYPACKQRSCIKRISELCCLFGNEFPFGALASIDGGRKEKFENSNNDVEFKRDKTNIKTKMRSNRTVRGGAKTSLYIPVI